MDSSARLGEDRTALLRGGGVMEGKMEIWRKMQELPVCATVPTGTRVLIARSLFSQLNHLLHPPPPFMASSPWS